MSETTTRTQIGLPAGHKELSIRWTHHPWRDDRRTSVWAVAATLAVFLLVTLVSGKPHLGVFAALAMGLAMWRVFVPVGYRIGAEGVRWEIFGRSRLMHWPQVDHIQIDRHGIGLSPEPWLGILESLRRLHLPWPPDRDTAVRVLRTYASHKILNEVS